jgi:predicted Zn-dependent protease
MAEAGAMGLPVGEMRFDRAMTDHVRGEKGSARTALMDLSCLTPADARVWMALVMTTGAEEPVNRQAMKMLHRSPASIQVRLALAWVYLLRMQWSEAQAELDQAIQMDSRNPQAWELLTTVAQITENKPLMQASLRNLLALVPTHPFLYMNKAQPLYQAGEKTEAEAEMRTGLRQGRNPSLLNGLANIIMENNGDLPAARSLVEEALRKQPFNPIFRCTRGELNLKEGRIDEAERDVQQVLSSMPNHAPALLLSVQVHSARGETSVALELSLALARRQSELSPEQRNQLKKLVSTLKKI